MLREILDGVAESLCLVRHLQTALRQPFRAFYHQPRRVLEEHRVREGNLKATHIRAGEEQKPADRDGKRPTDQADAETLGGRGCQRHYESILTNDTITEGRHFIEQKYRRC